MKHSVAGVLLTRLAAAVLGVSLTAWSAIQIYADRESALVRNLADAIAAGDRPRLEVLDRIQEEGVSGRIIANCNSANLNALVAVKLRELDLAIETADEDRAGRAYEAAEAAVYGALRCAPMDGNLWLRLSMLDVARGGPSWTTIEYLKLSYWTAPSEASVIRGRVEFASRLLEAGVTEVEQQLRSDVRTLVRYDSRQNVADMYLAAPASARTVYREWIGLLPEQRRQELQLSIEHRGGNLNVP